MSHQHQHEQQRQHQGTDEAGEAALAELVDLDAEVLHSYLSEVTGWIGALAGDRPPHRLIDLGSGTGTGTFALLERFGAADAIAVDLSAEMLGRVTGKAGVLGLADRVRTVQADLDAAWPAIGPADLVWASASMHHLADPDRVLAEILAALLPGGRLVVAEIESFPRFLPDDIGLGRPGLEARCQAVLADMRAADLPYLGADWGARLTGAGFTVEAERTFDINLTPPLPPATSRYAEATLRRIRSGLDGKLTADDLATLDTLLASDGPDGIRERDDLTVRTTRMVWVAGRPETG
jgi:SAM-dependent methyltransferase